MNEIEQIKIELIDTQSTINVRRQGVEENVKKIKDSIAKFGYWSEQPIVVRPHPDSSSSYKYEHVTGQCRFRACLELGLPSLPALILDLNDDEAIQRSWGENEARGDMTMTDKSYWVEKIHKKFSSNGYTSDEALKKAADFLGVQIQTAMNYYSLAVLPDGVKDMVDQSILPQGVAREIVKNTYQGRKDKQEASKEKMADRADWYVGLERDHRKYATDALKKLGHNASIEKLDKYVSEKADQEKGVFEVKIPSDMKAKVLEWGKSQGIKDEQQIIIMMISDTIQGAKK